MGVCYSRHRPSNYTILLISVLNTDVVHIINLSINTNEIICWGGFGPAFTNELIKQCIYLFLNEKSVKNVI